MRSSLRTHAPCQLPETGSCRTQRSEAIQRAPVLVARCILRTPPAPFRRILGRWRRRRRYGRGFGRIPRERCQLTIHPQHFTRRNSILSPIETSDDSIRRNAQNHVLLDTPRAFATADQVNDAINHGESVFVFILNVCRGFRRLGGSGSGARVRWPNCCRFACEQAAVRHVRWGRRCIHRSAHSVAILSNDRI